MTQEISEIGIDKLSSLFSLLKHISYDEKTNTLTIDSDINIKVTGNYKLETDKHIEISSNHREIDSELNIPFSVFINSDECKFVEIQEQVKRIIE